MSKEIGKVEIYSEDLSRNEIQTLISNNSGSGNVELNVYDEKSIRGFTEVEWVTFALMAIPATESLMNIVLAIKNTIKARISKHLRDTNTDGIIRMNVKIKLPFFSYEKNEELIINSSEED